MKRLGGHRRAVLWMAAIPMLGLLALPVVGLLFSTSPTELSAGFSDPMFAPALGLSLKTTLASLAITLLFGTPLAWVIATLSPGRRRVAEIIVALPIVLPPAVVGIALLQTFGRSGMGGETLNALGIQIPFTTLGVVIAQVVVAAPFYVHAASAAFRRVDPDLLIVARTLGQTSKGAFLRVALPLALPGMLGGAALAWARALGEFGATLLFAGNLSGTTQTMPLAIYTALESDVRVAISLSLVLAGVAFLLLWALRSLPFAWGRAGQGAAPGGGR